MPPSAPHSRRHLRRIRRLSFGTPLNRAFRAGGYAPEMANRFIRRFKQKIEEGLALGR